MQKPYKIQDIDPIVMIFFVINIHHYMDRLAKNEQNLPHGLGAMAVWNLSQSQASLVQAVGHVGLHQLSSTSCPSIRDYVHQPWLDVTSVLPGLASRFHGDIHST